MSGYEQRAAAFFEVQQIMFDQPLGDAEARDCLAAAFEQVAAEARGLIERAVKWFEAHRTGDFTPEYAAHIELDLRAYLGGGM